MFALSFFGIIHVPINVPALGAAVKEDNVNVNRELIAHGISNTISGCVGSIQACLFFFLIRIEHMANKYGRITWYTPTASCSSTTVGTADWPAVYLLLQPLLSGWPAQL